MAVIENINVSSPNDGLGDSLRDSQIKANTNFAELNDKKVEKVAGKDLSANNFTDLLKTKLDGIEDGAEVNVQPDWSQTDNLADDYIKNKPDLSQYFSAVGGFDYNHSIVTPVSYTSGNLQLANDGLGAFTQTNLAPYGVTQVWDATTNTFQFGELSIGDEVLLRVHIRLTTTANNQTSGLSLLFGEGTASEYNLPIDTQIYFKDSGNHDVMKEIQFYIGNEDWRVTPVKLLFNSSANASVLVYGWHPYIIRKSVNILDINDDNYKTFSILSIVANSTVNSITAGGISIGYNSLNNKINRVVFDIDYSKYIYNYDQIKTLYDFNLNWFDKDTQRTYISFISGFTAVGSHYILDLEETLNYTDFILNDKIEVFINATKKSTLDIIDDGITSLSKTWSSSKLDGILTNKADLVSGKVPASQLPSYVDDVLEFANLGAFPLTGETGKLYVALDTEKLYRWTGSVYVEISAGVTAHSQLTLDDGTNPHGTTKNDVGLGNVDNTSDVNKPIATATQIALNLKEDKANKGIANGYVPLNASTLIDSIYLPSYVDDIIEVADFASLPLTGEIGKIYVTLDNNKIYRWSGSVYVEMAETTIPSLQEVTDIGSTTTNSMTANSFIKSGGTASQFLKADGSVDTNTYLTGASGWGLQGNAGTNPATDFIGTTDAQPLIFKSNGVERARILQNGNWVYGNTTTTAAFDIAITPVGGLETTRALRLSTLVSPGQYIQLDVTDGSANRLVSKGANKPLRITNISGLSGTGTWTDGIFFQVPSATIGQVIDSLFILSVNGNVGIGTNVPSEKLMISGNIRITGAIKDSSNSAGGSGDILSSTVTGTQWISGNNRVLFKTVASYALMIADGIPIITTIYNVTTDENKSYTRGTYLWKPDGNREWLASTPDN